MKKWLLLSVILCFVINTANSITQQKISPTLVTNPNKVFPENRNSEWSDRMSVNKLHQDMINNNDTLYIGSAFDQSSNSDPSNWSKVLPDGTRVDIGDGNGTIGILSHVRQNGDVVAFHMLYSCKQ